MAEKITPEEIRALRKARRDDRLDDYVAPSETETNTPQEVMGTGSTAVSASIDSPVKDGVTTDRYAGRSLFANSNKPVRSEESLQEADEVKEERPRANTKELPSRSYKTPHELPERDRTTTRVSSVDSVEQTQGHKPPNLTSLPGGKQEPRFMSQKDWALVNPDTQYHLNQAAGTAEIQSAPQLAVRAERVGAQASEVQVKTDGPLLFERPDEGFKETNQTSS